MVNESMSEDSVLDLLCTYEDIINKQSKGKDTKVSDSTNQRASTSVKKRKSKKRHICELCNREFTNKCGLTNHLLIHAGIKPFTCEICSKTFTKKCTLTVHLLTHSSEKPHICEICDKSFARKNDLKKHKFVHTDEKGYVCDICKAQFKHKNNLRRHKLKHFSKEQKIENKAVKKQDALISLLIESYRKKQTLMSNENTSNKSDTISVLEELNIPIDENENISEPEIITEIFNVDETLETLNSDLISGSQSIIECENVNQTFVVEDDLNLISDVNLPEEVFAIESESKNDDVAESNLLVDSELPKDITAKQEILEMDANLESALKSPQFDINPDEDVLVDNPKIKQGINNKNILSLFFDNIPISECNTIIETIQNNNPVQINSNKEDKHLTASGSKISSIFQDIQMPLSPDSDDNYYNILSGIEQFFSCDICGELFDEQSSLLMHVSNHGTDDLCKCYICDANFDTSDLLQSHLLTHSDIPIEDMEKIGLDEDFESNFTKFGPLALGEISLEDIDKIGLDDDDFDEKVARMYALAHVEISLNDNESNGIEDLEDDDGAKVQNVSSKEDSFRKANISQAANKEHLDLSSEISKKTIDEILSDSLMIGKNFNLQNLEVLFETDKIGSNDKLTDGHSKLNILKKIQIPVKDIDDISLSNTIQEIVTKLHSDSNLDFSIENASEAYKNLISIDLPDLDFPANLDFSGKDMEKLKLHEISNCNLAKAQDLLLFGNLEDGPNQNVFSEDIIDKVRALMQLNAQADSSDKMVSDQFNISEFPEVGEDIANKVMSSNTDAAENNLIDFAKQQLTCPFCDKTFAKKLYLQTHYLTHLGIRPYSCKVCYQTFTKKCTLTIHSLIHSQIRKYTCNECEKSFLRKTDLQKHSLIHSEKKPYVCNLCQKGFTHQNNLRRHKLNHANEKFHVCSLCSKAFSDKVTLLSHMKIHIKQVEVDKTNEKLTSELRNYLQAIKEKLHACSVCGAMFARLDRLRKHKLTHSDQNLYLCEMCGSTYKNKSELQTHMLNHIDTAFEGIGDNSDEIEDLDLAKLEPSVQNMKKTYTCNQCFKVYTRSSALKYHYLTHTREKLHKCPICQKYFGQRTTLKRHILTHSGIKSFTCKFCDKSFAWESSLRKHCVTHISK